MSRPFKSKHGVCQLLKSKIAFSQIDISIRSFRGEERKKTINIYRRHAAVILPTTTTGFRILHKYPLDKNRFTVLQIGYSTHGLMYPLRENEVGIRVTRRRTTIIVIDLAYI